MTYLDLICWEYVAIVSHLIEQDKVLFENDEYIFLDRKDVETYMDKKPYHTSQFKLSSWKRLRLTITERDKTTWQYVNPETKKRMRVINVSKKSYVALKKHGNKPIKVGKISKPLYKIIFQTNARNIPPELHWEYRV